MWQPGLTLEEIERASIIQALKFFYGNRTHAAEALGIALRTMTNKLTKYKAQGYDIPPAPNAPKDAEEKSEEVKDESA